VAKNRQSTRSSPDDRNMLRELFCLERTPAAIRAESKGQVGIRAMRFTSPRTSSLQAHPEC
jgi:hypothetical protein